LRRPHLLDRSQQGLDDDLPADPHRGGALGVDQDRSIDQDSGPRASLSDQTLAITLDLALEVRVERRKTLHELSERSAGDAGGLKLRRVHLG
jgi:hypothetical protein